jgi:protocatechuate 3,4-dioxygenase beta subunit
MAGPFYPLEFPLDDDNDLTRVKGRPAPAKGQIADLSGRVLDADGRPLRNARVEIWQCDANGRYHHVDDGAERERDPGFQGYGAAMAGADGGYRFRTIRPVPYPGRSPHIHVRVSHPAAVTLTTQMYVRGDPAEADSGWFRAQGGSTRDRLSIDARPAPGREAGALEGRFDLVLARR